VTRREKGSRKILDLLVKEYANIERMGPRGNNALFPTCKHELSTYLELLFTANTGIFTPHKRKQTGYHLATVYGHPAILKTLFEKHPLD
jgi:hypothetical protein